MCLKAAKKKDIVPFAFLFKRRSKQGKTVQEVNGARTEWLQWVADVEISRMHLSTQTKPERRAWNGEKGACRSTRMGISFHSTSEFVETQWRPLHRAVKCVQQDSIVITHKRQVLVCVLNTMTSRSHLVLFVHQYPHWFVWLLWAWRAVGISVGPQGSRSS